MIEEAYCNLEIAELLKEKEMDKECFTHYIQKNNSDGTSNAVTTCTQQMAMRWLREVYKIDISIYPYGNYSSDNYQFDVYENRHLIVSKDDGYMTYEEAVEAAIKYCLENLI